jgi:hypothetical protein
LLYTLRQPKKGKRKENCVFSLFFSYFFVSLQQIEGHDKKEETIALA